MPYSFVRQITAETIVVGDVNELQIGVEQLSGGIWNVKEYGAIGNGVANDTAAIIAANTACNAAGGGVVYFPPGTYLMTPIPTYGVLVLHSNTTYRGVGPSSIIKVPNGQSNWSFLWESYGSSNIVVEQLKFDQNTMNHKGERITSIPGAGAPQVILQFGESSNVTVQNCHFDPCSGTWTIKFDGAGSADGRKGCRVLNNYFNFVQKPAATTTTTTLTAAISSTGATTCTIASAAAFAPDGLYYVQVDSEVMQVTAGQGTTTLTISRGQEGTAAATHSNGATIRHYVPAFDNSCIWLDGQSQYCAFNEFRTVVAISTGGAQARGAKATCELHGGPASYVGNIVYGYETMVNLVADARAVSPYGIGGPGDHSVIGNTGRDMTRAICIWGEQMPWLYNGATIANNSLHLAPATHGDDLVWGVGIVPMDSGFVTNVVITGNTIRFQDFGAGWTMPGTATPAGVAGINIANPSGVQNCTISHNVIEGAPINAIFWRNESAVDATAHSRNNAITDNLILNPGSNLSSPTADRSGIYVYGIQTDLRIEGNQIRDDYATKRATYGVFWDTTAVYTSYTRCTSRDNPVSVRQAGQSIVHSLATGVASGTFLPIYTAATLPAAASNTGMVIYVSDGTDSTSKVRYSNGTSWLNLG